MMIKLIAILFSIMLIVSTLSLTILLACWAYEVISDTIEEISWKKERRKDE